MEIRIGRRINFSTKGELSVTEAVVHRCSSKLVFLKNFASFTKKKPVLESLSNKVTDLNDFFSEHFGWLVL